VPECGVKITTNCIYRVAWAINHDPWYIQVDWNGGVVFLNTQYINWPINDTWIWIGTLQHTTPAWTYLFQLISFKPPTTTTTTTSPVVTTVSVTTTVTSTTTAPPTTVTVTKPVISTTLVIGIVVIVVVIAAVAALIALRRR
jgi:peptide/nickel transport system substrate-binding protein